MTAQRRRRALIVALIAALVAGAHTSLHAQQVFGTALDARVVDADRRCTRATQSAAVTLVSGGATRTVALPPGDRIHSGERLRLPQSMDVRVRADAREAHNNEIVLAPDLLCGLSSRMERVVDGIRARAGQEADFEFITSTERSGLFGLFGTRPRLTLVIRRGAAIVSWPEEATIPLYVHAAGETIRIDGTVVAVAVDSTGREGIFFLQHGTAALTTTLARPEPLQLFHLRDGQRSLLLPEPTTPLAQSVQYHTSGWPLLPPVNAARAWYQTTGAKVGGGLLIAGGITALVVSLVADDDGPRSGTIVVRFPR